MSALPYVTAPGNVTKALEGIVAAATPERVSQDFVKEVLKIPGGSGNQITSFLKKIGFAGSDGVPTLIYRQFRNESTRGQAAAAALKEGYGELYRRNEYAHEMSDAKLKGLIIEVTGAGEDSSSVTYASSCFKNIRAFASFDGAADSVEVDAAEEAQVSGRQAVNQAHHNPAPPNQGSGVGLNLSYTINLNLPATKDIAVFNAIFKSLRENLLENSADE